MNPTIVALVALGQVYYRAASGAGRLHDVYFSVPVGAGQYPDCDRDAKPTPADVECFLKAWQGRADWADCDRNGVWDVRDFACFTTALATGPLPPVEVTVGTTLLCGFVGNTGSWMAWQGIMLAEDGRVEAEVVMPGLAVECRVHDGRGRVGPVVYTVRGW